MPVELEKSASLFIKTLSDDVSLYKLCKAQGFMTGSAEADAFVAWWNMRRYEEQPKALIFLYEKHSELVAVEMGEMQDAFMFLSWQMYEYYEVLKELELV